MKADKTDIEIRIVDLFSAEIERYDSLEKLLIGDWAPYYEVNVYEISVMENRVSHLEYLKLSLLIIAMIKSKPPSGRSCGDGLPQLMRQAVRKEIKMTLDIKLPEGFELIGNYNNQYVIAKMSTWCAGTVCCLGCRL